MSRYRVQVSFEQMSFAVGGSFFLFKARRLKNNDFDLLLVCILILCLITSWHNIFKCFNVVYEHFSVIKYFLRASSNSFPINYSAILRQRVSFL